MHECPDCGRYCTCCGDIEDLVNPQPRSGCACPCWQDESRDEDCDRDDESGDLTAAEAELSGAGTFCECGAPLGGDGRCLGAPPCRPRGRTGGAKEEIP